MPHRTDDDRELVESMAVEMQTAPAMDLTIAPSSLFTLVALVQLALRHPGVPERLREVGDRFVTGAVQHFGGHPAIQQAILRGNDPAEDRRRSDAGPE